MNPTEEKPTPPPPLTKNLISHIGWMVTITIGTLNSVMVLADIFTKHRSPYGAIVTYLLLPGFLCGGVGLILFGAFLEWRRRHRKDPGHYPTLPTVDLNQTWQRRRVLIGVSALTLFFGGSAIGVYQTYHFTESQEFCGLVCHSVMKPEYTAYQHSPHAKVLCTECHIGGGAEWYVRSKLNGMHQVYALATNTYHLPIDTPVKNLRRDFSGRR